ncbi:MAG: GTP 3',8-cyclase MoaA [Armatimonadetes bacterium]|nr:GTP 3',8-cyclase MoaA [Armatimonadota bacterium]
MSTSGKNEHTSHLADSYGRVIRDLRISVTDRCNFRCVYCLPEQGFSQKTRSELLNFDEIERLAHIFVRLGINKIRITGGEPLLRRGLPGLLARLNAISGLQDLAMTTNGFLLAELLPDLLSAGLRRFNISLDSLDGERFQKMTGRDGLPRVHTIMTMLEEAGVSPVKFNCVLIRGMNDDEILSFAEFAQSTGHVVRFIEFMPLDAGQAWRRELVVPGREVYETIHSRDPLTLLPARSPSETARRYTFQGGKGEIGIISSVTEPFCGFCNRIRLTADGKLRTCLFSAVEYDLKGLLRENASDEDLLRFIADSVVHKERGHRINEPDFIRPDRTMSCIGG